MEVYIEPENKASFSYPYGPFQLSFTGRFVILTVIILVNK